jgi:hypothetical protein
MSMKKIKHFLLAGIAVQLFFAAQFVYAATLAGTVMETQGDVLVADRPVARKGDVYEGDTITTGSDGELLVRMTDGTTVAVRPNSVLKVDQYRFENDLKKNSDNNFLVRLLKGGLRTVTGLIGKRNPKGFKVATPTATIGVRGTDFEVAVVDKDKSGAEAGTYNKVFDGATFLENNLGGRVEIGAGQVAFSPLDALQAAKRFGLLKQVPDVFFNGRYDNLLNALQDEALNRLNSQLGGKLPSELRNMLPKLGDLLRNQ